VGGECQALNAVTIEEDQAGAMVEETKEFVAEEGVPEAVAPEDEEADEETIVPLWPMASTSPTSQDPSRIENGPPSLVTTVDMYTKSVNGNALVPMQDPHEELQPQQRQLVPRKELLSPLKNLLQRIIMVELAVRLVLEEEHTEEAAGAAQVATDLALLDAG
jgi:hypothetical protein